MPKQHFYVQNIFRRRNRIDSSSLLMHSGQGQCILAGIFKGGEPIIKSGYCQIWRRFKPFLVLHNDEARTYLMRTLTP